MRALQVKVAEQQEQLFLRERRAPTGHLECSAVVSLKPRNAFTPVQRAFALNGLNRATLKGLKSRTLRVTTVSLWRFAVAAIIASS